MSYSKLLLVLVAVGIGVSMTALTATVAVDETRSNIQVEVNHSPLNVDTIDVSSSNGTIDTSVVTTADGVDRLDINLPDALVENDTFELSPELRNEADGALTVRLSTNTSENVEITGFSSTGSTDIDPVQVTSIGEEPTVIEFELAEGQSAAIITVEYEVTSDEAGGQFDLDMFLHVAE
ncbi:MAG: hypothetical protein A07HR60_02898 [uncultured archaeon A07HR60]|jgi:hypothetical protein|nr:MAG: hypothetical protein A07HR60_02898 [uncultured archaeon A07HR60]